MGTNSNIVKVYCNFVSKFIIILFSILIYLNLIILICFCDGKDKLFDRTVISEVQVLLEIGNFCNIIIAFTVSFDHLMGPC